MTEAGAAILAFGTAIFLFVSGYLWWKFMPRYQLWVARRMFPRFRPPSHRGLKIQTWFVVGFSVLFGVWLIIEGTVLLVSSS
jgi:hypothetical protein